MQYTIHCSDTSSIEDLPDEVLFDILLRLDIPELHALSLVLFKVKSWHTNTEIDLPSSPSSGNRSLLA